MKKLFIGLLFLIIGTDSKEQQLSINELTTILTQDENRNEYYLNSKGFTLDRLDTKDTYTTTWYAYRKNPQTNTANIWVALSVFSNGEKTVLTDFSDLKHFTAQKKIAERLGFKFKRTVKESNTMRFQEYIKGKLVLRFWTFIDKSIPDYEIALSQN